MAVAPKDAESGDDEVEEGPEGEVGVDEETKEVGKGLERDAVTRPRAVVIHLGDAASAVPAVVCPGRLGLAAFFAPAGVADGGEEGGGGGRGGGGNDVLACGDSASSVVGVPEAEEEGVEEDGLAGSEWAGWEVGRGVEDVLGEVAQEGD